VERCNILETDSKPIPVQDGRVVIPLGNYEIVTLRLLLRTPDGGS
jgi:hypothetical protein